MSKLWVPAIIYTNLQKFIQYRGISTTYRFLSDHDLSKELEHVGYLRIDGTRNDLNGSRSTVIFMIAPRSEYATKSEHFKKLLMSVETRENTEVLFIADIDEISTHINKQILIYRTINPTISIEFHSYARFILIVPEHKAVPPMRILSKAEIEALCDTFYTTKDKLPKIRLSDPSIIWLGAKPGNVVEIKRDSDNCVESLAYRLVIRN